MKLIATALVKAQSEMGNASKVATNPFFKSKYADLNSVREAVLPILNKHGIAVLQPIVHVDGKNFVKTIFLHESGEMLDGLTEIIYSKQNDAQAQGSGISYSRRYGLQCMACIGAEDDDAQHAVKPDNKPQPAQPAKTKPQFTEANFEKAFEAHATIEQIKTKYEVTKEIEAKYLEFSTNKNAA